MPKSSFRSRLSVSAETAFDWHERAGAFERLTPPWEEVRVVERKGGIREGDTASLRVKKGPVELAWEVVHRDFEYGRRFVDEQVKGPFAKWVHEHRFVPDGPDASWMEDEIEWEAPLGAAGEIFGAPVVERDLKRLFRFRHHRLAEDLALHDAFSDLPRRRVAITGASGMMGRQLQHLLTTGGHEVVRMVRSREAAQSPGTAFWSIAEGEVDLEALRGVDVVVHLAGETINAVRWTAAKKRAIRDSRVEGTRLLAEKLAGFPDGPRALVCASAVGVYGNRGDELLDEDARPGKGFLAETVVEWEGAARRAEGAGLRVVKVRMGVVLSETGGALPKMLWAFKSGLAGRIGKGRQYVPWIDLDDATGLLYHAAMDPGLKGVLNGVAPNPVTNAAFTDILGRVLRRPTVVPVPSFAVRTALGEMGEELLLASQRVSPRRTLESGYRFRFTDLEASLRHQLGREEG